MHKTQNRYKNGSVELRGTRWFLRFRDGDNPRKRALIGDIKDFPNKRAAERASAGIRERINTPGGLGARKTMNDLIDRYIAEEMPEGFSTSKNYRHYLRCHIRPEWGTTAIADIKAHEVRTWLREIALGDKTRSHVHGLMRILFRFAMLWEWYPATINPMQLFRLENSSRRAKTPRTLTPEEFNSLAHALAEPYRSMVIVCACLGLRCSELVGLQWQDINWFNSTLTVSRAVVGNKQGQAKTQKSSKPLPIAAELMEVFTSIRSDALDAGGEEWIFPSSRDSGLKPWNAYAMQRYQITPTAERIGLGKGIGWHTLRHSYRTWLDRLGAPIGVQRDLMRHTDIRTTMNTYGDSYIETMRGAQDEVAKLLLQ